MLDSRPRHFAPHKTEKIIIELSITNQILSDACFDDCSQVITSNVPVSCDFGLSICNSLVSTMGGVLTNKCAWPFICKFIVELDLALAIQLSATESQRLSEQASF